MNGDKHFTIMVDEVNVKALESRAARTGYSVEGYLEALANSDQRVVEEMCYVVFEGVPNVFSGVGSFEAAEEHASFKAGEGCNTWTVMAVPKAAVETGLAARWSRVVVVPLAEARKTASCED